MSVFQRVGSWFSAPSYGPQISIPAALIIGFLLFYSSPSPVSSGDGARPAPNPRSGAHAAGA